MGTLGEARGTVGACLAEFARLVVLVAGVLAPFVTLAGPVGTSTSEDSGVDQRELAALNEGRSNEVNEGDGGRGVGGRL